MIGFAFSFSDVGHGVNLDTSAPQVSGYGELITVGGGDMLIDKITKDSNCGSTYAQLYFENGTLMDNVSIIGDTGTLSQTWTLNANQAFRVETSGGSGNPRRINTVAPHPVAETLFEWTIGSNSEGTGNDTVWNNVFSISVELASAGPPITVLLIGPSNNSKQGTDAINFTANHTTLVVKSYNLTNTTYFVWYSNGTLFNETTVAITGQGTNTSILTIEGFNTTVNTYVWNTLTCVNNVTLTNCSFQENNFTFDWVPFSVTDQIWKNFTVEGSLDMFSIELAVQAGTQISGANLFYDGVLHSGIINDLGGGSYNLTNDLVVPSVTANENKSFFWQVILDNGFQSNTTAVNQTVLNLAIDDCSVQSLVILNYTLVDEETQNQLNLSINGTIDVFVQLFSTDLSNQTINFSKSYTNTNNASVCITAGILANATYSLFTTVKYDANGYVPEFHHIQNQTLSSTTTPINITLFDLTDSSNTNFLITFKDENFLPVKDALINIQRHYIGEGLFKSIEIPKTDNDGRAVGHFDDNGVAYTITVTKDGQVLATFENIAVVCANSVIGDCNINLNVFSSSTPFDNWNLFGNISIINVFDEGTRTISTTFNTGTGTTSNITVIGTVFDRFGNNTACTNSLISSAGTLTCVIPQNVGNATIIHKVYKDGTLIRTEMFRITPDFDQIFQGNQIILVLVLMMTIPLMLIGTPISLLIGVAVGLIMSSALMIFNGGSYLGPASMMIWVLASAGIIIWKIASKE